MGYPPSLKLLALKLLDACLAITSGKALDPLWRRVGDSGPRIRLNPVSSRPRRPVTGQPVKTHAPDHVRER